MAATSRDEKARLDRLAGSGQGSGGGLPLPVLFAAMLNEVLDNESVSTVRMVEIASTVLGFKLRAVFATWSSWEIFTADVLAQMESRKIIQRDGDSWVKGPRLVTGQRIEVIPARKGKRSRSDGVTVWPKDERENRSHAVHVERDATALIANPRPVDRDHVQAIRDTLAEVGQLYPVLTDKHGRLLDGRHRRAADPNWPSQPAKRADGTVVSTEAEALAVIRATGIGAPLPSATVKDIDRLLGEMAKSSQIKRDRIRELLLEDASRSNREIGEDVGASHNTVTDMRAELQEIGQIDHFRFLPGRGGGKYELVHEAREGCCAELPHGPVPTIPANPRTTPEETREAVIQETLRRLRAGEPTDFREMAKRFDVGESVVQRCIAIAQDRLKHAERLAGEIPSAPPIPSAAPGIASTQSPSSLPAETVTAPSRHSNSRRRPVKVAQRISRLLNRWESEPDDPESELDVSAELEDAEALRQALDEWIEELRRR